MSALQVVCVWWAICGLAFWLDTLRFNGLPQRWRNKNPSRELDWSETIFFYLPVSLVGGPLWWVAMVFYRIYQTGLIR